MVTNNISSSNPQAEKMGDVLDAMSSGIDKTAASETEPERVVNCSNDLESVRKSLGGAALSP